MKGNSLQSNFVQINIQMWNQKVNVQKKLLNVFDQRKVNFALSQNCTDVFKLYSLVIDVV